MASHQHTDAGGRSALGRFMYKPVCGCAVGFAWNPCRTNNARHCHLYSCSLSNSPIAQQPAHTRRREAKPSGRHAPHTHIASADVAPPAASPLPGALQLADRATKRGRSLGLFCPRLLTRLRTPVTAASFREVPASVIRNCLLYQTDLFPRVPGEGTFQLSFCDWICSGTCPKLRRC
jgi:hypothetical protein